MDEIQLEKEKVNHPAMMESEKEEPLLAIKAIYANHVMSKADRSNAKERKGSDLETKKDAFS